MPVIDENARAIPADLESAYGTTGRWVYDHVMALRPGNLPAPARARLEQAAQLYAQSRALWDYARTSDELTDAAAVDRARTALTLMGQARAIVEEVERSIVGGAAPVPTEPAPAAPPAPAPSSAGGSAGAWVMGGLFVAWLAGRARKGRRQIA